MCALCNQTTSPRIYAACLAAYNNGQLHGIWIDATQGAEHIYQSIHQMLQDSLQPNAEEWAIHDYEGFEGIGLSEYEGAEHIVAKAEYVNEYGALGAKLLAHYGDDLDEASQLMQEGYFGEYTSAADFAEETYTNSASEIPEGLRYYIDWEAMARDMEINGEFFTVETGFEAVHVFIEQ